MSGANAKPSEKGEDDGIHGPQGVLVVAFLGNHPIYVSTCPECGVVSLHGRFPTVMPDVEMHAEGCSHAGRR